MPVLIQGYIVSDDDKEIYDYFGIPAFCPANIRNAIKEANGELLDIEIGTCYGGDVWSGSEIYSAIKQYGKANITVTGLAASAASVIAMAAHCIMSPPAQLMVHNASTCASGNYHDMDKASEQLKVTNKSIAAVYVAKSGMSEEDALAMMESETWLSAKDALAKGLVDEIMSDVEPMAAACSGMLPKAVIEKTRAMLKEMHSEDPGAAHEEPKPDNSINIAKAKLALQLSL